MPATRTERAHVLVQGLVQGVGFRPFAFALAQKLHLGGSVRNRSDGVLLELEGSRPALDAFLAALREAPPPLARITHVAVTPSPPRGEDVFAIEPSTNATIEGASITPDAATCDDCLAEILAKDDRRAGYAFANCTACGPRLTIIEGLPYDRARTTMAVFAMCEDCLREYEDPTDRRFHAQPNACAACGPRLSATIEETAAALRDGAIMGVKGLGGYHLACDATNEATVRELRHRKHRDEKPFAIMVRDAAAAADVVDLPAEERALLESSARPIVLLRRRGEHEEDVEARNDLAAPHTETPKRETTPCEALKKMEGLAPSVAPGTDRVGVMLPYSPLHHLLVRAVGRPLVMTSGNLAGEPIAHEDDDARARLGPLVDRMLSHDRPIHLSCDDSVAHIVDGAPAVLRRARGHAPAPLALPWRLAKPTLALGGELKACFALGAGDRAFASHHLGDLEHLSAWAAFRAGIAHYERLVQIEPRRVVHDLHPDYATTAFAAELERAGLDRVAVQHHEAHVASALAEHGVRGPAIGVAYDGAGWGTDGAIWGGELFTGTCGHLERAAHLRYVALPGGDAAARDPWRMAIAHLEDAGVELDLDPAVRTLLPRSPRTSSVGRLFDAVAALVGLGTANTHEARAAVALQALAERASARDPYPFVVTDDELDVRPMIDAIATSAESPAVIARRFHATLAAMTATACERLRARTGAETVVLTGGVFANVLLANETAARLRDAGFAVHLCRAVPTNDGGLAYGQLATVASREAC